MMLPFTHPRGATLLHFAHGEAAAGERRAVAGHLERCARCRAEVAGMRAMRAAARDLPAPAMRQQNAARVLARRAAGDRVILPDVGVRTAARRGAEIGARRLIGAAAALLIAMVGWMMLSGSPSLEAGTMDGDLRFSTTTPRPGDRIEASYRPSARLAQGEHVVLRGIALRPGEMQTHDRYRTLATLERDGDGMFRGSFVFPDSAVYIEAAVEDTAASQVDDNGGSLWTLLAHDAAGTPLLEAMELRLFRLEPWHAELLLETAREMTRVHPNGVTGWRMRLSYEKAVVGPAAVDSLKARYVPELRRLHQVHSSRADVPAGAMANLLFFSDELEQPEIHEYWRARALREHPGEPSIVQQRVFWLFGERLPRRALLERMDALHAESERAPIQLLFDGFRSATNEGDRALISRWGERLASEMPSYRSAVALGFARTPGLEERGLEMLREALADLATANDATRRLTETRAERARRDAKLSQTFLVSHGRALTVTGQTHAALDTLAVAERLGWSTTAFRAVGDARLTVGDTAGALPALAKVFADPVTPAATRDSLVARLGAAAAGAAWRTLVDSADAELRAVILADGERRRLPPDIAVRDGAGGSVSLASLLGPGTGVVVFISRNCPPALVQLGLLPKLRASLAGAGVPVIMILSEPETPELRTALEKHGYEGAVYYDATGETARAFRQWGTPHFFVVEGGSTSRFGGRSTEEALLQVAALQGRALREVAGSGASQAVMAR